MSVESEPRTMRTDRRTLVRGAAWTVPVVAASATAPAYAASPCDDPVTGTVNFAAGSGNYQRTHAGHGQANVVMSDASALVVTFTSVMTAGYSRASNNLEHGASGPFPGDLGMLQTRSDANTSHLRGQRLTISFGRPVFDLQLPLSSFSWPASDAYQDAAWVSPAPTSVAYGSNVTGAGAQSDVFRNPRRGNNPAVPYSGATTTVTLTYAGGGGLSELVVHYFDRAAGTGHTNQGIAVLNMNFKAKRLGCT